MARASSGPRSPPLSMAPPPFGDPSSPPPRPPPAPPPRRGQPLGGVPANENKHPEARGTCPAPPRQQRLIHQALDHVEDLAGNNAIPGAHRRGGFQVEAPREDRQPGKQLTLGVGEEFMAPVQRRPDRLVARI